MSNSWLILLILGSVILPILIVGLMLYKFLLLPYLLNKRLQKEGIRAKATIIGLSETSMRINNKPVVELKLSVRHPYNGTYETSTRKAVSYFAAYQFRVGAIAEVLIDPNDPTVLIIDKVVDDSFDPLNANNKQGKMSPRAEEDYRITTIHTWAEERDSILEDGVASTAIVQKFVNLGFILDGETVTSVELLVTPANETPFLANTMATLKNAAMAERLSPNSIVKVRYLPENKNKVVIEDFD